MTEAEKNLYQVLKELDIMHEVVEHPVFATCEESGDFYAEKNLGLDCKNLFLPSKIAQKT